MNILGVAYLDVKGSIYWIVLTKPELLYYAKDNKNRRLS